ncbi:MAG: hypothetical protein OXN80_06275, partial [bacterium]|nr:hypothetical protein [bacterium]
MVVYNLDPSTRAIQQITRPGRRSSGPSGDPPEDGTATEFPAALGDTGSLGVRTRSGQVERQGQPCSRLEDDQQVLGLHLASRLHQQLLDPAG